MSLLTGRKYPHTYTYWGAAVTPRRTGFSGRIIDQYQLKAR